MGGGGISRGGAEATCVARTSEIIKLSRKKKWESTQMSGFFEVFCAFAITTSAVSHACLQAASEPKARCGCRRFSHSKSSSTHRKKRRKVSLEAAEAFDVAA